MSAENLHMFADAASILTFIIAAVGIVTGIFGFAKSRLIWRRKSSRLEEYLKAQKAKGAGTGKRSILRIVRDVGITQDEIIRISFENPRIARRVRASKATNLATDLLFEYVGNV